MSEPHWADGLLAKQAQLAMRYRIQDTCGTCEHSEPMSTDYPMGCTRNAFAFEIERTGCCSHYTLPKAKGVGMNTPMRSQYPKCEARELYDQAWLREFTECPPDQPIELWLRMQIDFYSEHHAKGQQPEETAP